MKQGTLAWIHLNKHNRSQENTRCMWQTWTEGNDSWQWHKKNLSVIISLFLSNQTGTNENNISQIRWFHINTNKITNKNGSKKLKVTKKKKRFLLCYSLHVQQVIPDVCKFKNYVGTRWRRLFLLLDKCNQPFLPHILVCVQLRKLSRHTAPLTNTEQEQ